MPLGEHLSWNFFLNVFQQTILKIKQNNSKIVVQHCSLYLKSQWQKICEHERTFSVYFWFGNYIYFNNDAPYDFEWTHVGCEGFSRYNKSCISMNEPGLPHDNTFWDNYLCATLFPSNTALPFKTDCNNASVAKLGKFVILLSMYIHIMIQSTGSEVISCVNSQESRVTR